MSKRNTGHVSIQLEPGEAAVVMDTVNWEHVVMAYRLWGSECSLPEEADKWNSIADAVEYWMNKTAFSAGGDLPVEVEDDDGWR